jgi:hypothetical protein
MPDDDDKTSVGHGPADDTEVVAPATESADSDGLAWSLADAQDYQTRGHWRDRLLWGGLVLLLCADFRISILQRGCVGGPIYSAARYGLPPPAVRHQDRVHAARVIIEVPAGVFARRTRCP